MNVNELAPAPTKKVRFLLASFKSLPKEAGCYVLTTFDGYILYVGLTDNFYDRFRQHLLSSEKTSPTSDGKAIWFYFMNYAATNLPKLERSWLNQFVACHSQHPILNKKDSPI